MNRQSDSDALRSARRQIIRSLLLSLAALGVIVIACYAWFVRNSSVTGALGSISAETGTFELASVGGEGFFDRFLPDTERIEGVNWPDGQDSGRSSGSASTILWRIENTANASSHLGNHTGGTGIEPGSNGTLQFYVVPKRAGDLRLTFTIHIIPLIHNAEVYEQKEDSTARDFLKGHLLLHYRVGSNQQSTLITPESGSFTLELTGLTTQSEPVLVSLDWYWPFLLENAVDVPDVKSIIEKAPRFFLHDGSAPLTEAFTLPAKTDPLFRRYSNFYNNADQYIGTEVDAVLFRLTAVEG